MNRTAKIGALFTVATVLITIYMLKIADSFGNGSTYPVYAYLSDATGLLTDSKVSVSGVPAGMLRTISLENGKARVDIDVYETITLYRDATLTKKMESMLGTYILTLTPGHDTEHPLQPGDEIKIVSAEGDIQAAMESAEQVAASANSILKKIDGFLGNNSNQKDMRKMFDTLVKTTDQTSQSLARNMALLEKTLRNFAEISQKVNRKSDSEIDKVSQMLTNSLAIVERIQEMLDKKDGEFSEAMLAFRDSMKQISSDLKRSRDTIDNVKSISKNLDDISAKIANGEGTIGKIVNDEQLYEDITNISHKLSEYADTTFGMKIRVNFDTSYMVKIGKFKSSFGVMLQPTKKHFYYIGLVDDPRGNVTTKTVVHSGTLDGTPYHLVDTETEITDKWKFNAQIGRRFGPIILRGGLVENYGGFGIDYLPIRYFRIGTEMFHFSKDGGPNLKFYASVFPFVDLIEPFSWIYFRGGVDDVITDQRDYFFGGGVGFNDDSLKSLISAVPISP